MDETHASVTTKRNIKIYNEIRDSSGEGENFCSRREEVKGFYGSKTLLSKKRFMITNFEFDEE